MNFLIQDRLKRIQSEYNPEHDVGTPMVTWAEKILVDAIIGLSSEIDNLKHELSLLKDRLENE